MLALAAFAASLSAATLATVNGDKITSEDADVSLSQQGLNLTYEQLNDEQKKQFLDGEVARKLLSQQAKKSGVEKDSEYKSQLAIAQEQIAIGTYLKKKSDSTTVSDAEVKKLYDELKAQGQLDQPEQARARHILVAQEGEAKDIIKTLSKKKGAELEAEFEKIAKEKSTDKGSAERGGDLGYFSKDRMVKEFSDAAFALKNGEITKTPVKSNFGYHIILVIDRKAAGTLPFGDIADRLKERAKATKFNEALEKEIADLKSKAKISYEK
ncbi:MAG: peptidylprolyl isomerase [Helicobacteraceae bacterium]|jgi:peptidylprolyl isomerase|nr:peptidylprolyl isomerase [Helicobacteraceae bacterium]